MDRSFICKLFCDDEFLGTVFFISNKIAYTASHCFDNGYKCENCYIEFNGEKYKFIKSNEITELDFVELTLDKEISKEKFPEILIEHICDGEKLQCYGYKMVEDAIEGVVMNIHEYPLEFNENEKADFAFMIDDEVDYAEWKGISGCPVYCNEGIKGVVIKNCGGDGLKTRIKVISFNKIIKYLVQNNKDDMLENIPEKFTNSKLRERICKNEEKCNELYYCFEHDLKCDNIDLRVNFFKDYKSGINEVLGDVSEILFDYALFLEEQLNSGTYINPDIYKKVCKRLKTVEERMSDTFNKYYITLWMFTEGIIGAPRVARILTGEYPNYIEEDIYLKKDENSLKLLIPIISEYYDINKSILELINSIIVKEKNNFINIEEIEWDMQAIKCLDFKSNVKIGNIIRDEIKEDVSIEITALSLYNDDLYSNIPPIINSEDRKRKFMYDKFKADLNKDIEEYSDIIEKIKHIKININLFILPIEK